MIVAIRGVVDWFGDILSAILNLTIPTGLGTSFTLKSIFLYLMLMGLAWKIIKMFLSKGHLNSNGKD